MNWLVMIQVFLFSLFVIPSLAFFDLAVNIDEESGELMKPSNWSDTRFQMLKMIRLRELLQETMKGVSKDSLLFPEDVDERKDRKERKKRRKRSVNVGNIGVKTAPYLAQGLYKQDRSLIPPVNSAPTQYFTQNAGLYFGKYSGSGVLATDLMFQVSSAGNIQVHMVANDGTSPLTLTPTTLTGSFNVDLENPFGDAAASIKDVVLGYDGVHDEHFVAVAVHLAREWPSGMPTLLDPAIMEVNDPISMPVAGRSRVYKFSITETEFTTTLVKTLPTIEAVDAEFWTEDDELYLAIAHRGNYTLETENSQSVLLKNNFYDETRFEIIQGYKGLVGQNGLVGQDQLLTDLSLVTHNPKTVIQFTIHSRSFLVFANQDGKNYTGSEDTFSPIYRYNISTGFYDLFQQVPTFAAEDVSFCQIVDTENPLNTQSFLVFANFEDNFDKPVESFIFKYIDGQFLPFQGLLVINPISVTSFTHPTTQDIAGSSTKVLEHFIVFLTSDGDLVFYQYDGTRFKLVVLDTNPTLTDATDVDTVMVSDAPTLRIRYASRDDLCSVGFDMSSVLNAVNPLFTSSNAIRTYVDYWTNSDNRLDFPLLQNKFDQAPRPGAGEISITNATFAGSFTVENIIIDPLLREDIGTDSSLVVADKTAINATLITNLENYVAGVVYVDGVETVNANAMAPLKTILDGYNANIAASAKKDEDNVLLQDVHFNEVQVNTLLETAKTDIDVDGSIVTHDGSEMVDLVEYMAKAVIILDDGSEVNLNTEVSFENIRIEGEYTINTINDVQTHTYVKIDDDREIGNSITFEDVATFKGAVTVAGTVDGVELSTSKLLLKSEDQIIEEAVVLKGGVEFADIRTSSINGFDLSILNTALVVGNSLSTTGITTLIVDELEIHGTVLTVDEIGVLDADLARTDSVHLGDLVTHSIKKTSGNVISIPTTFDEVSVGGNVDIKEKFNGLNFPGDFVPISDPAATLHHPGTLVFSGDTIMDSMVLLDSKDKISSGTWTFDDQQMFVLPDDVQEVVTDDAGNLDLLLLFNPCNAGDTYDHLCQNGYENTVTGKKKFDSVLFKDNVAVSGNVLGYLMEEVAKENDDGVKIYTEEFSVNDLVLTGSQDISSLVLDNGVIQTSCGVLEDGDVSCLSQNDFATIYSTGVKRTDPTIPNTIASITFTGAAVFEDDLSMDSLNTLDADIAYVNVKPSTDFMPKSGTGPFVLTQPMEFSDKTKFDAHIGQTVEGVVGVCQIGYNGQCLCNDCVDVRCQEKNHVCLVKSGVVDPLLYSSKVTHKLSFIDTNSLKITGDQEIKPRLVLKGGFQADKLEVTSDDCTINSVPCNNIAQINSAQTFTGYNIFHGSISTSGETQVNTELSVTGTVDNVDTSTIFTDTLFKESQDGQVQVIAGATTINEDFTIDALTTNNVLLKTMNVQPADLFSSEYVLRADAAATITSNLVFAEKPTLAEFTTSDDSTVTWDGVTIQDFFNNLWVEGLAQTLGGDVYITGNVELTAGIEATNTGLINNVDIVELDTRALRISGTVPAAQRELNDASFTVLRSTDVADGLKVTGEFLGLQLADAVKTKDNGQITFSESTTFEGGLTVTGNLELTGNIVPVNEELTAVPQDELWNFLKNDATVKNVKVISDDGVSTTNEPTLTSVNSVNLANLRATKWYKTDDVQLPYPITFSDVQFSSKLLATHLNNVDLVRWRDRYLSLSKDQEITEKYIFANGVAFNVPVSVEKVFIGVTGTEGNLITETQTHKFVEHYFKLLFKNTTYTDVAPILKPNNLDVLGDVLMDEDITLNNIDLSEDVLTYKVGDSKTFSQHVDITGDLLVVPDSSQAKRRKKRTLSITSIDLPSLSGDLAWKDETVYFYQDDEDEDGYYKVQVDLLEADAVKNTEAIGIEIEITGDISISNDPTFTDLTLSSTLNGADIGTCAAPNILTTDNCGASADQTILGAVQFGTMEAPVDITFTKVLGDDLVNINGENWKDLMDKMISKTDAGSIVFNGAKTFTKDIVVDDDVPTTFSSTVFGLDLDSVIGDVKGSMDMKYHSDAGAVPVMPDLVNAVDTIKDNSAALPNEFLYMQPIIADPSSNRRVRTLGMLNKDLTQDLWDNAPFHMASLSAEITTNIVTLKFNKITFVQGIAISTPVDLSTPVDFKVSQSFDFSPGDHIGDIQSLYSNGEYLYALTTRSTGESPNLHQDFVPGEGVGALDMSGTFYNYLYAWDPSTNQLVMRQKSKQTIHDLEPVQYRDSGAVRSCIVSCGQTSRVYCPTEVSVGDPPVHLINAQTLTLDEETPDQCFQASSSSFGDEDMVALARGKNTPMGKVDIYRYNSEDNNLAIVQTVPCLQCSFVSLGSYADLQLGTTSSFLVIGSTTADFAYVGQFKVDRFEVYQRLPVSQPIEAHFYNKDGNLYLSVLSEFQSESMVSTFILQGSMAFLPVPDWTISLPGVTSHEVLSDPLLRAILITTTGIPFAPLLRTGLTANTVMQALYKQSNVEAIRAEVSEKLTPIPKFLSTECKTMVTNYANKLYYGQEGPSSPEQFAKLLLRLMPRPYLHYNTVGFSQVVKDVLSDEAASYLTEYNPANAVVNFYKYQPVEFDRDLTSTGYTGTAFVYQDLDGVLYIFTRFKDSPYAATVDSGLNQYRNISFWSSCESDATQLTPASFASQSEATNFKFNPVETNHDDEETRNLCMMVHDFGLVEELKNIKGKEYIGALRIAGSTGDRFACGLLKHPEQAMVQFLTDHGKDRISFHPYGQTL